MFGEESFEGIGIVRVDNFRKDFGEGVCSWVESGSTSDLG